MSSGISTCWRRAAPTIGSAALVAHVRQSPAALRDATAAKAEQENARGGGERARGGGGREGGRSGRARATTAAHGGTNRRTAPAAAEQNEEHAVVHAAPDAPQVGGEWQALQAVLKLDE